MKRYASILTRGWHLDFGALNKEEVNQLQS